MPDRTLATRRTPQSRPEWATMDPSPSWPGVSDARSSSGPSRGLAYGLRPVRNRRSGTGLIAPKTTPRAHSSSSSGG
jgi:hypothetical protein